MDKNLYSPKLYNDDSDVVGANILNADLLEFYNWHDQYKFIKLRYNNKIYFCYLMCIYDYLSTEMIFMLDKKISMIKKVFKTKAILPHLKYSNSLTKYETSKRLSLIKEYKTRKRSIQNKKNFRLIMILLGKYSKYFRYAKYASKCFKTVVQEVNEFMYELNQLQILKSRFDGVCLKDIYSYDLPFIVEIEDFINENNIFYIDQNTLANFIKYTEKVNKHRFTINLYTFKDNKSHK